MHNYIITANTDIGLTRETNQDSVAVKVMQTPLGRMALAVLCDGMGGLSRGELASAEVIRAFDGWVQNRLPTLCETGLSDAVIRREWESLIQEQNRKLQIYGSRSHLRLGTTVVALLLTQTRYYLLNVGDSRAYILTDHLEQMTRDQTFLAREIARGNMTPEQAKTDERRSVLLQCVGASEEVYPEMFFGDVTTGAVYMLCSDGFCHEITTEEIFEAFNPQHLSDRQSMNRRSEELIRRNKQRMEKDNITVALIRTR